ncbi:MAG: IS1634 family transposase [Desulfovibrionales bacterium]|nr:MAG: IS1634 family transposase [Desulfovibrionales bacterium]
MAHLHKKMKKGRPYYYVREMARIDGKPKVTNQVYLGSPERIMALAKGTQSALEKIQVQEFGALWLADLIDQDVGITQIVDEAVPRGKNETGPSVGEYFLYAVFNRMVDATSKRALADWYGKTAIQQIRPVDFKALSSEKFWKKWDRVSQSQVESIAREFFAKLAQLEISHSDCFLFDTTNYYTYMAGDTKSDLARTGKNKDGRYWLRQVGLALLVARDTGLPFFYREYEGNCHDSKVFQCVLKDVLDAMRKYGRHVVTVVVDKGINSEDAMAVIDAMDNVHFVTSYSTSFAEELIHVGRDKFVVVDTEKNRQLRELDREDDQLTAWRTTGEHWGQTRTVVVTDNPLTTSKQRYKFEAKLRKLQSTLYEIRSKVRSRAAQWRSEDAVRERYRDICRDMHLPDTLYDLNFSVESGCLVMSFRKNQYRIERHIDRFGKNVLITDRMDWSTDEIVRASLDRYMVEQSFRQTKDDDLVNMMPMHHWTDSKIRCHVLSCIVALSYLRLLEVPLSKAGLKLSAATVMQEMQALHSCLCWHAGARKAVRMLEEPSEAQAQILKAMGYEVSRGVLQELAR